MASYERRYVLCPVEAAEVVGSLGAHLTRELHDPARPISFTRTTYLDTADLEYLRSSYGPVARRLRVRQYATARGPHDVPVFTSPAYLELKESFGTTRLKRRLAMSPRLLTAVLAGAVRLLDLMAAEVFPSLARVVAQLNGQILRPTLTTWYRRSSYASADGAVRLTIDRQLVFAAGEAVGEIGQRGTPRRILAAGPARVLEVKCAATPPAWLTSALSGRREASWFTKYRCGMEVVQPARRVA